MSKADYEDERSHSSSGEEKASATYASHVEDAAHAELSPSHREYLLLRHKTLDLNPLPSADPADPLNWPAWKKNTNLVLIALQGMLCVGSATSPVPAFYDWSIIYNTTITKASYIATVQLAALGIGPLFWIPVASKYGRRPVWIISTLAAGLFDVGGALSQTYGSHMVFGIFAALFICPGMAMGQAVVAETFFSHERGVKMGIWALFITIGTPVGPLLMGFVVQHLGWPWVYWLLAIVNFTLCVLYIFFSPETVYNRDQISRAAIHKTPFQRQYLNFRRISTEPLSVRDFLEPILMLKRMNILVPTIAYVVVFNFTLMLLTVEVPALVGAIFHLNAQEQGLNFSGLLIGCVLGELVAGAGSDYLRNRSIARDAQKRAPPPEQRLWLAHIGFVLVIAGVVVFLVRLDEAEPGVWNITPIVGMAIGGFGAQIVTTIIITYCSDSYPEEKSPAIGVAINLVRGLWGFLGPFWFPNMFASCGLRGSAGLIAALVIVFSIIPILFIQYRAWRQNHHE